jgi:hypothetical protein
MAPIQSPDMPHRRPRFLPSRHKPAPSQILHSSSRLQELGHTRCTFPAPSALVYSTESHQLRRPRFLSCNRQIREAPFFPISSHSFATSLLFTTPRIAKAQRLRHPISHSKQVPLFSIQISRCLSTGNPPSRPLRETNSSISPLPVENPPRLDPPARLKPGRRAAPHSTRSCTIFQCQTTITELPRTLHSSHMTISLATLPHGPKWNQLYTSNSLSTWPQPHSIYQRNPTSGLLIPAFSRPSPSNSIRAHRQRLTIIFTVTLSRRPPWVLPSGAWTTSSSKGAA